MGSTCHVAVLAGGSCRLARPVHHAFMPCKEHVHVCRSSSNQRMPDRQASGGPGRSHLAWRLPGLVQRSSAPAAAVLPLTAGSASMVTGSNWLMVLATAAYVFLAGTAPSRHRQGSYGQPIQQPTWGSNSPVGGQQAEGPEVSSRERGVHVNENKGNRLFIAAVA